MDLLAMLDALLSAFCWYWLTRRSAFSSSASPMVSGWRENGGGAERDRLSN